MQISNSNNNDIINHIKSSLPIEDIIGEKIRLRRAARGFMGLCPFHHENTPSFHVYTDTQSYYCFGCHEAGDIISFVMKSENISYPEALAVLADRAGVKLDGYSGTQSRNLYDVMNMAASFFRSCLMSAQGTAARSYMKRRNMNASDVDRFTMGYAPSSWDGLIRYLRDMHATDREILSCGLALQGRQGSFYDRFRGRLMFGIRDIAGKIIAFGGRLIDGEGAKYINSPESSIYRKRNNLYLLDTARKAMRDRKRAILVEGYMDAVRLHKCGFTETIASLGTSLTETQAKLLARMTDRCYICYDSDTAGQNATLKSMYILAENGLDVRVISIPEGKDPDEFLSTHDPADFTEAINSAKSLITHHLSFVVPKMQNTPGRRKVLQDFFGELSRLDRLDILDHKGEICDTLGLRPSDIEQYIDIPESVPAPIAASIPRQDTTDIEAGLCALLESSQQLRQKVNIAEMNELLSEGMARNCFADIMSRDLGTDSIAFIARGNGLLAQIKDKTEAEKWQSLYSSMMWHKIEHMIQTIAAQPIQERDMQELLRLKQEQMKYSR